MLLNCAQVAIGGGQNYVSVSPPPDPCRIKKKMRYQSQKEVCAFQEKADTVRGTRVVKKEQNRWPKSATEIRALFDTPFCLPQTGIFESI